MSPLRRLKHLHLGIFLSDEQLLTDHNDHIVDDEPVFLPRGCDFCTDEETQVLSREMNAAVVLADALPQLESVAWSSFFVTAIRNVDTEECKGDLLFKNTWSICRGEEIITAERKTS